MDPEETVEETVEPEETVEETVEPEETVEETVEPEETVEETVEPEEPLSSEEKIAQLEKKVSDLLRLLSNWSHTLGGGKALVRELSEL